MLGRNFPTKANLCQHVFKALIPSFFPLQALVLLLELELDTFISLLESKSLNPSTKATQISAI